MLIKMTTHKPLMATGASLQAAAARHRFGVMHIHNLKETMLATLKPTALVDWFGQPALQGVAQEVEDTMLKIMSEAAQPA